MISNDDPDDDFSLFRKATRDVTPLKPDNRVKRKRAVVKKSKHKKPGDPAPGPHRINDVFSDEVIEDVPDVLSFSRAGVQPATLKKLRQGKLPIDDRIDLHGMTINEARDYLLEFLEECKANGSRCILIVHGKGFSSRDKKPVIKPLVNRWLQQLNEVLAFHSAIPADGGTGAIYVLLRKPI